MKRNMRTILVIALVVSLAGTALAYAERGKGGPGGRLTEERREAVHTKVEETRAAGASREEIHGAVREMLEAHGIETPEGSPENL